MTIISQAVSKQTEAVAPPPPTPEPAPTPPESVHAGKPPASSSARAAGPVSSILRVQQRAIHAGGVIPQVSWAPPFKTSNPAPRVNAPVNAPARARTSYAPKVFAIFGLGITAVAIGFIAEMVSENAKRASAPVAQTSAIDGSLERELADFTNAIAPIVTPVPGAPVALASTAAPAAPAVVPAVPSAPAAPATPAPTPIVIRVEVASAPRSPETVASLASAAPLPTRQVAALPETAAKEAPAEAGHASNDAKPASPRPAETGGKPGIAGIHVEGIFWSDKKPAAILNDQIVEVGDLIQGMKVKQIKRASVVIEVGGKDIELGM